METWEIILIVCLCFAAIIGNISLLRKSATPIRKKSLNELQETLPRTNRSPDKPKTQGK